MRVLNAPNHATGLAWLWVQILWTFSIYLEAVAILPQLVLLQRTQNIDNLTGNYVFLLGCGPHTACAMSEATTQHAVGP